MSTQPGGAGCRCARQVNEASVARTAARGRATRLALEDSRERVRIEHRVGGDVVGARGVARTARRAGRPRRRRRRARTAGRAGPAAAARAAGPARAATRAANGPANRRRISGPASRLKISPGRSRTIAEPRRASSSSSMCSALRPCGARRTASRRPRAATTRRPRDPSGPASTRRPRRRGRAPSTPAPRRGLEHAPRPLDVHALELGVVAARLDQPREVDHGVGAGEVRGQVVARDVGRRPSAPSAPATPASAARSRRSPPRASSSPERLSATLVPTFPRRSRDHHLACSSVEPYPTWVATAAMKALTWHGTHDVRVDTVPDPTIEQPDRRDHQGHVDRHLRHRPAPLRGARPLHRQRRHPRPRADGHRRGGRRGGHRTSSPATAS